MDGAAAPAPLSLRQQRNFWLVWLGQAAARQGDGIAGIAMVWWLVEKTGRFPDWCPRRP